MQIAVIGMGCYYPGAENLLKLWENILTRRQQFRRIPEQRLPLAEYHSPDRTAPDKTYGAKAALIDGYRFDWAGHSIPKMVFESTDIAHWIALDTALAALADAGYARGRLPGEKTGVMVGNTLTGEVTRSNLLRLRWPYVRKTLRAAADRIGMPVGDLEALTDMLEEFYKAPFPAINEDSLAGGLSNTIAGRICNYLDLNGGGYTVDGACSSSMLAIATAMTHLTHGDIDLGIAGGVDISLDPFELVGFAKARALSPAGMHVYDRNAQGFIPGEGAGFVVLKRHEDAVRDGDYIYAVARGWGVSSDGKGGLIAPSARGQSLAISRAYQKSPYGLDAVDFVEGHGTGTRVGDAVELSGISLALGGRDGDDLRRCGVTSVKSIIGHTKAASGAAGFIKAVLAVNQRVIPPTAGCQEPNGVFEDAARHLYPVLKGQIRPADSTLRAGITGAGFGGINCHITLESGHAPSDKLKTALPARALLASHQGSELFVFDAPTPEQLLEKAEAFKTASAGISYGELPDLAFTLSREVANHPWRACIVADTPEALQSGADELMHALARPTADSPVPFQNPGGDVLAGRHEAEPRIGFLFPGQGSQLLNSAEFLLDRYEGLRQLADEALQGLDGERRASLRDSCHRPLDRALDADQRAAWETLLARTDIAQPAICLGSLLWSAYLRQLGIEPAAVGGHSLGELSALHAAGVLEARQLMTLAAYRGEIMAETPDGAAGAMLGIGCDVADTRRLLEDCGVSGVSIANINTPSQTVVSGHREEIARLAQYAGDKGIFAKQLPVSNAFHSPMMEGAAGKLQRFVTREIDAASPVVPLFSAVSGKPMETPLDLAGYLARQVVSQVDFVSMTESMASRCDLFIEVGPRDVLSKCVRAIFDDKGGPACYPVEAGRGADAFRGLNRLVGACFVRGQTIRWDRFYHHRLLRPYVASSEKSFIVNPCERVPFDAPAGESRLPAVRRTSADGFQADDLDSYLEKRKDFILDVIRADLKSRYFPSETATAGKAQLPPPAPVPPEPALAKPAGASPAEATVLEVVAEFTGFEPARLSAEHRLLDDLNLDSIKSATLVGEIARRLDVQEEIDPITLANAAIGELVALFSQGTDSAGDTPAAVLSVEATVLEVVAEFTGFEPARLSAEHRLLDDLNLDSIKSATLVGEIARRLDAREEIDPITLANAAIGELVSLFASAEPAEKQPVKRAAEAGETLWIRNFTETLVPVPLPTGAAGMDPSRFVILQTPQVSDLCEAIGEGLRCRGHEVGQEHATGAGAQTFAEPGYHLVLPLGEEPEAGDPVAAYLESILSATRHAGKAQSICFVQAGRGICSCRSFARTLHLENPALRIAVLEWNATGDVRPVAAAIEAELQAADSLSVAVYDEGSVRHEPYMRYSDPAAYEPRALSWDGGDTLLVTGGAKGITRACALAFAVETGVKLAILGRSPADSPAVVEALDEAGRAGIVCRYYTCDVAQLETLRDCVERISGELGPVTGILHGAGLNRPKMATMLSAGEAYAEIAPKLIGARNLAEVFHAAPPKLFAAFSSIIGITGMPGNAAYGFSNESLTHLLRRFGQRHPETQILALAYSVWGETGMGARMGSAALLEGKGIRAIPTDAGVSRFLDLMRSRAEDDEVVVTANLGSYLDTWRMATQAPPANRRFLEEIVTDLPGVELRARVLLNLEKDSYLKDHQWRGSCLFPTVFGLEAMAQAVARVTGMSSLFPLELTDIALERPIVVGASGGKGIEISALVRERSSREAALVVDAWITTDDSRYRTRHFSATFNLGAIPPEEEASAITFDATLGIDPKIDLYGWLLFQGEQFQRIERVRRLNGRETVFDTCCLPGPYVLGDPFCRDSLLHAVQLPVTRDICLPERIDRWSMGGQAPEGTLNGQAIIREQTADHLLAEVLLRDRAGHLLERLEGYRLKILEHHEDFPSAENLADPVPYNDRLLNEAGQALEKALPYRCPFLKVFSIPGIDLLPGQERHPREEPLIRRALDAYCADRPDLDPTGIALERDSEGRPFLKGLDTHGISLSHDNGLLLVALGGGRVGCDLQTVTVGSEEQWRRVLTPARMALVDALLEQDRDLSVAATRVWSLLETLRKIGGDAVDAALEIVHRQGQTVVFSAAWPTGLLQVATLPVKFALGAVRILATSVSPRQETAVREASGPGFGLEKTLTGPQGQAVFSLRQPLSFKDLANPGKGAYFSNYFVWMGKVRELPLKPIYDELVPQFTSGRWGMVTNHSKIVFVDEAAGNDILETRTWLGPDRFGNRASFTLHYEWHKLTPAGETRLVAVGEQSTSWVEIVGHGLVELRPAPDYLNDFFRRSGILPRNDRDYLPAVDGSAPLAAADWGARLYAAPAGPNVEPRLDEVLFHTTLEDANLVGNIYFANYPMWQGRVRDQFFHTLAPSLYGGGGADGELFCVESSVDHLREAMPFDRILVRMSLKTLYANGIVLWFDYYRKTPQEQLEKLATGEHKCLWVRHDRNHRLMPAALPDDIIESLGRCCGCCEPFPSSPDHIRP